jgi:hypothetical protein
MQRVVGTAGRSDLRTHKAQRNIFQKTGTLPQATGKYSKTHRYTTKHKETHPVHIKTHQDLNKTHQDLNKTHRDLNKTHRDLNKTQKYS